MAKFKVVFARHGIQAKLVADHVPFTSAEMALYVREWGFKITHSSPTFPQSNGLVGKTIQLVKNMLKAAAQTGVDPHMVLLHLRNTSVTGLQCSPTQLLMGHVLCTSLPSIKAVLRPAIPVRVQQSLAHRQWLQKEGYDKRETPLAPFQEGEKVCMETAKG